MEFALIIGVLVVVLVSIRWAALTITNSQVIHSATDNPTYITGQAGETFANAAIPFYRSSSDQKFYKALNDTAAHANVIGFSTSEALANQTMCGFPMGQPILLGAGAAPASGTTYYLGDGAGEIVPYTDVTSAKIVTVLGIGTTGNKLDTSTFKCTGVAKP